jgi:hypothetical protein
MQGRQTGRSKVGDGICMEGQNRLEVRQRTLSRVRVLSMYIVRCKEVRIAE